MKLNTDQAPTSPRTTRSSYLYNGKVVNHNMQIVFSDRPVITGHRQAGESEHVVNIQSIDPNNIVPDMVNSVRMLIEEKATESKYPKMAYVWQQVVGKEPEHSDPRKVVFYIDYKDGKIVHLGMDASEYEEVV